MAIQEQVDILKQGADTWNKWIRQHRAKVINLNYANLSNADLSGANLSKADLRETNLIFTDLNGANLREADLTEARLSVANLRAVNLSLANLAGAILYRADLSKATLHGTSLIQSDLSEANLSEANLRRANLAKANFSRSNLSFADFDNAIVRFTHFADLDLRMVKGLETVHHWGPSYISTSTLERSQGDIPEVFLRGTGLSDTFIEYVRSLVARPIEYYTCFLSYSCKDQDIAERLYADLQSKEVRCWYAPHELKPGDYYRHKIDESIRIYDKLVLILSSHSVESEWVEKEVDIALNKEESMDMTRQVLFPLRLDNAALQSRRAWVRSLRYHRHIGDFTGWKDHDTYQTAFERLLSDLKAEPVKRSE